ncbi:MULTISPECIES: alanine/glycine:cation symporter family protein [Helcococcus]|uniref:Sodium:alanine symporter family protein n=1 Tax=Helcococcus bovis TaxID=3153252 RepID=A0ABW9F7C9_9FIRM
MSEILKINKIISNIVWGWPMIILLLGAGLLIMIRTKGIIFRKFGFILKNTFLKMFHKNHEGDGTVTPFQAVATALAATVGTGNIAGVSLAIAVGGPGAVFWIWISAFFGMFTKYAEVVLSIVYREKNEKTGHFSGGPMYYLKNGAKMPILAFLFSIFGMLASFGIGNMTQSNSITQALKTSFNFNPSTVGIIVTILSSLVLIGGLKNIAKVTGRLVPVMAFFYIFGSLIVIFVNYRQIPSVVVEIFKSAFTTHAAVGGFIGSTILLTLRQGLSRGIFTNEAGLGSAPIAHSAAKTNHPVEQGIWGVYEVFMDTLVICTMTALVILTSDKWNSGLKGVELAMSAFNTGFNGGEYIVSIGLTLFAFSTIVGWYYYGERCFAYLFGEKHVLIYRIVYIPLIYVGAVGGLEDIWTISDTLNGLMAIPNLIGLFLLSGVVVKKTNEYFNKR